MADRPIRVAKSHLTGWLFCVLALCLVAACGGGRDAVQLAGATMGTSWHVTYLPGAASGQGEPVDAETIRSLLEAELAAVDAGMSTWRDDSELSAFNRAPVGEWVAVSEPLFAVVAQALAIGETTAGAYDVTVGPLVQLWGFGSHETPVALPGDDALAATRERVGQQWLEVDPQGRALRKQRPLELDLSSIAKGYAVDQLAAVLATRGIEDYLVEVGGEMRLAGHSPRGDDWRVAVERPEAGLPRGVSAQSVALGLSLSDIAVATSGDYRNFFELEGRRYSHTLDPRTGYPVEHDLVSVTVLAPTCMEADGWATALVVLGADAALALAEEQGLAVYLLQRRGEDFVARHSSAFAPWLARSPASA